jgi:hypothetical protein
MSDRETSGPLVARSIAGSLPERIIDSPSMLVALETPRPEALLDQFRRAAVRDGRAIYHYVPGVGIGSLREPGVHVPSTRSPFDALRHIEASGHFGIYVFHPVSTLGLVAGSAALDRLRQMLSVSHADAAPKRIVLMDRYVGIQAALEPQVTRIFDQQGRTTLRLRNGRWVE